jgi:hypothetical protein
MCVSGYLQHNVFFKLKDAREAEEQLGVLVNGPVEEGRRERVILCVRERVREPFIAPIKNSTSSKSILFLNTIKCIPNSIFF